jgi:hypothetical protein
MWDNVPTGSCVEKWFSFLEGLGADIFHPEGKDIEPDRYTFWCPTRQEFHSIQVSAEIADNCTGLETRLRNMKSVKDHMP